MGFQCVVTHSANDGLAAALAVPSERHPARHQSARITPGSASSISSSAIPQTRHIPVHVASVADYTQEALERGAIGYALKPVKREQLVDAFRQLEAKLSQGLRRVLVVEDDERQRESMRQLLCERRRRDHRRRRPPARRSSSCGRRRSTAWCMDLNLPDVSGYELLEQMAEQDDVSFPPVIVYTGRSLSRDEEQRLRRFSKSIIIKDARSPERLLDEVTLFLHQVESTLPAERQRMLQAARDRDATLDGRRILVVEDDVAQHLRAVERARAQGREGRDRAQRPGGARRARRAAWRRAARAIDLVLMDIMMPEMDGLTAMREIRKRPEWKKLPIIALTAKAMKDDQEKCLAAGANDYIAKPLDVEKLLSLVRVWMPK